MLGQARTASHLALRCVDRSGASVSTFCAIHCALTPMVATLLPLVGLEFLSDERTESILVGLSALIGGLSLVMGFRVHRSLGIAGLMATGFALIATGWLAERHGAEAIGTASMVCGGLTIAMSHLLSRRCCRATSPGGEGG